MIYRRIDQFLAGFSKYDAISNEACLMRDILRSMGFQSEIFAEHIHPNCAGDAKYHWQFTQQDCQDSVALFHFSIGSAVTTWLAYLNIPIITRYHNITPKEFFYGKSDGAALSACSVGEKQLAVVSLMSQAALADSSYNAAHLNNHRFARIKVLPLLRDYAYLDSQGEDARIKAFLTNSSKKTILFVGRISPNKAQQDLIELLKLYKHAVNENVRLILVGGYFSHEYRDKLVRYAKSLDLELSEAIHVNDQSDVIVVNNVSDQVLKTFYVYSDAFVCLSEHEGFCAPLLEAMHFGLPVLAHKQAAVPETVGQGGVLVDKRDRVALVENLALILEDSVFRDELIQKGCARVRGFEMNTLKQRFTSEISKILAILHSP